MSKRMQHCDWCGKELGVYYKPPGELDHCGDRECAREVGYMYQSMRDDARYEAEQDDFGRYR